MPDDIRDILFVFLVDNLSMIVQNQAVLMPSGLADFIRTEVIESNGVLPFPADLSSLLFIYESTRKDRF